MRITFWFCLISIVSLQGVGPQLPWQPYSSGPITMPVPCHRAWFMTPSSPVRTSQESASLEEMAGWKVARGEVSCGRASLLRSPSQVLPVLRLLTNFPPFCDLLHCPFKEALLPWDVWLIQLVGHHPVPV